MGEGKGEGKEQDIPSREVKYRVIHRNI